MATGYGAGFYGVDEYGGVGDITVVAVPAVANVSSLVGSLRISASTVTAIARGTANTSTLDVRVIGPRASAHARVSDQGIYGLGTYGQSTYGSGISTLTGEQVPVAIARGIAIPGTPTLGTIRVNAVVATATAVGINPSALIGSDVPFIPVPIARTRIRRDRYGRAVPYTVWE